MVDQTRGAAASLRASRSELVTVVGVMAWIGLVLVVDRDVDIWGQRLLGAATWLLLLVLARRETTLVRAQIAVVVAFATAVEYTFSPLLEVYVYRLDNVPAFVPPGHGLVYLSALLLGRTPLFERHARPLVAGTVVVGGAYAGWGLLLSERQDLLGAFWYGCLLGFLCWGRSRLLYVGAFLVVTALEIAGTALHTWTWQPYDPTGLVSIGNPPSGAAGGYGWFDLAALLAAPSLLVLLRRVRDYQSSTSRSAISSARSLLVRMPRSSSAMTSSWRRPLVATALPPAGPGSPDSAVNRPPASVTTTASAARSYSATSGSQAMSTAPSATSR